MAKKSAKAAPPAILWFRNDLRLEDNPALEAACAWDGPLVCVYILDEDNERTMGGARRWWLHHSLASLSKTLEGLGQSLLLLRGAADDLLADLVKRTGAAAVYWNRSYGGAAVKRDTKLKKTLQDAGVTVESFNGALLREPWEVCSGSGDPYKVFTAYWKASRALGNMPATSPAPKSLPEPPSDLAPSDTRGRSFGDTLEDWSLLPTKPDWAGGLRETWTPGEEGARARLKAFLDGPLASYAQDRDLPGKDGTSMLSPHLLHGEISPRTIWVEVARKVKAKSSLKSEADKFLAEIGWREFSYQLLFHNPDLPWQSLRPEFRKFPWKKNKKALEAWQKGMTGYPIVDAGMRQLYAIGWMHNRVRMIVGSLLVKHLLIPWQDGEAWFWDTLVDADPANNSAGWQWIAGCGADAAPYFRVFNPVLQGEKFDPKGTYIRTWVPELAELPNKLIHKPWEASQDTLKDAGLTLGKDYPAPIVGLKEGRDRALEAFQSIKSDAA